MQNNYIYLIMSVINNRIKEVRMTLNLTQEKFSSKIGLTTSNYGQLEIGKSNPTANVLHNIANEFHVNGNWLLTGNGKMFSENVTNSSLSEPKVHYGKCQNCTSLEQEIIRLNTELNHLKDELLEVYRPKKEKKTAC